MATYSQQTSTHVAGNPILDSHLDTEFAYLYTTIFNEGIGTSQLTDANVTTAKLADNVLSADATGLGKMADGFLAASTTGRAKMADAFVTTAKLGTASVTAGKVAAGAAYRDASGAGVFNTSMTAANTFQDLDLSGTVGANSTLVFLEITGDTAAVTFCAKPKGYGSTYTKHLHTSGGYDYGGCSLHIQTAGDYAYMTVATDSSGIIQIGSSSASATWTIKLVGYIK